MWAALLSEPFPAWPNLIAVVGGVAGSAFALLRLVMRQHPNLTDRFVGFLETSLTRQETTLNGLADSLAGLDEGVRENSKMMRMLGEKAGITFHQQS